MSSTTTGRVTTVAEVNVAGSTGETTYVTFRSKGMRRAPVEDDRG